MRIIIAGIVGGIVMFMWGFASHMLLPIGEMGLKEMTVAQDQAVSAAVATLTERGVFMFPKSTMDMYKPDATSTPATAPFGFLAYDPSSPIGMTNRLVYELASNILAALVAAIIASKLMGSYGSRVMMVTLMGLFAWLSISVSYWTWHGFTNEYAASEAIDQVVGWLLAGVAIAGIARPRMAAAGPA